MDNLKNLVMEIDSKKKTSKLVHYTDKKYKILLKVTEHKMKNVDKTSHKYGYQLVSFRGKTGNEILAKIHVLRNVINE